MNYPAALDEIEKGRLRSFYLLLGTEEVLKTDFIKGLRDILIAPGAEDLDEVHLDLDDCELSEALVAAQTVPFLSRRRLVVVSSGDKLLSGGHPDEDLFIEYLKSSPEQSCLVMDAVKADRRRKVFQAVKNAGGVVDCGFPEGAELFKWIRVEAKRAGVAIDRQAAGYLVSSGDWDLFSLRNEIAKLAAYVGRGETIDVVAIDAVGSGSKNVRIFALLDGLTARNAKVVFRALQDLRRQGEVPLRIVFMVARHFRNLIRIKALESEGYTPAKIREKLGLHPFEIQKAAQIRGISAEEMVRVLESCHELELAIKTGSGRDWSLLESSLGRDLMGLARNEKETKTEGA